MKLYLSPAPHIRCQDSTRSIMMDVLIALLPATAVAVWYFGPNVALLVGLGILSAILSEYLWQKLTHKPVLVNDLSAAVTGLLVALNMPANAPWWMTVIGSFLAIILVKQLFGGIGDNFVNPALAARAILLASWPARMSDYTAPTYWSGADAVSMATPLRNMGDFTVQDLFFGNIPGTVGEVCKAAILVGFLYLLVRRVISWRIPVTLLAVFALCMWIFGKDPLNSVLTGGVMFGAVFMATDYTTCPMSKKAQFIYAALCGFIIAIIRCFGKYPEGVTYGILIMNVVTPLLDKYVKPCVYGRAKEAKADA
jgi:electron transport complex protein RnfD